MTWYLSNSSGLVTNRILNRLGPQTSNHNFPIIFPTWDQRLTSLSKQVNIYWHIFVHTWYVVALRVSWRAHHCAGYVCLVVEQLCSCWCFSFGLPNGKRVESDVDWQVAAFLLLPEPLLCSAGHSEAVGSKCCYNHLITLFSSAIKPPPYMLG